MCGSRRGKIVRNPGHIGGAPRAVLGPILFLLYINDLPENITSQVRLFADDTAVYLTVTSKKDSQTLQQDLQTLEQ